MAAVLDAGAALQQALEKVATLTKRLSLAAPDRETSLQEWGAWEMHRSRCAAPIWERSVPHARTRTRENKRTRAHAQLASVHCAHATVCQVGARTRGQLGGRVGAVDCDSPRMPRVCFRLVYVLKR